MVLGVIPARYNSIRLRNKLLVNIGGHPLIYYTWKQAKKASAIDALVVATDSEIIANEVRLFGGEVIMTPPNIRTGSDRVAVAAKRFLQFKPDIVVNIQGDEPLIPPGAINKAVKIIEENPEILMSTVATSFDKMENINNPNLVKVVIDKEGNALYFSRSKIPHFSTKDAKYLKHVGIYAFEREFLFKYVKLSQTPLEKSEKLEQLRVLENGIKLRVIVGKYKTQEVNTRSDLQIARKLIAKNEKK